MDIGLGQDSAHDTDEVRGACVSQRKRTRKSEGLVPARRVGSSNDLGRLLRAVHAHARVSVTSLPEELQRRFKEEHRTIRKYFL